MLNVTVVQPKYYQNENPDEKIASFLIEKMQEVKSTSCIFLQFIYKKTHKTTVATALKAKEPNKINRFCLLFLYRLRSGI